MGAELACWSLHYVMMISVCLSSYDKTYSITVVSMRHQMQHDLPEKYNGLVNALASACMSLLVRNYSLLLSQFQRSVWLMRISNIKWSIPP